MTDKPKRASLRGRGWEILTGKPVPESEPATQATPPPSAPLGRVELTPAETEELLAFSPPAFGIRDAIAPIQEQVEAVLDAVDTHVGEAVARAARTADRILHRFYGDAVPQYAEHPIDETALPYDQAILAAEAIPQPQTSREGEFLKPPPPDDPLHHEALSVRDEIARLMGQDRIVDLSTAKLHRHAVDELSSTEPEQLEE